MGEPLSPDRVFDFLMDEPEPHPAYDFFMPGPLPGYADYPNNNNGWIEADVPLLGELGAVTNEPMVGPLVGGIAEPMVEMEEQVIAPMIDMEEDIAMLFGDVDFSDDDSEGFEDEEEVWEVDKEWLMAPVTPPTMSVVPPPSTYEVGGPSTAAAEGQSFPLPTSGLPVPLTVIEDLSTRMGNLEYGHGQLVKKVMASQMVQVVGRLEQIDGVTETAGGDECINRWVRVAWGGFGEADGPELAGKTRRKNSPEKEGRRKPYERGEEHLGLYVWEFVPAIEEVVGPVAEIEEEQVIAPIVDMEEDLATLFGDDDFEDDAIRMGFVRGGGLRGHPNVAVEGPSFPHSASGLPVPPSVIEDLSTRLGNLRRVRAWAAGVESYLGDGALVTHAADRWEQTTVTEMGSQESTMIQCILGMDRRLAELERRPPGSQ
ncbi:hypothetical protein Tco_0628825 [Tanacetum coccineum]|uniref:Uncharacterized protein n=1 Tax=Tanacetum coccineum TaxID=301880 RepID=A0ABQ4WRL6_9ASTR